MFHVFRTWEFKVTGSRYNQCIVSASYVLSCQAELPDESFSTEEQVYTYRTRRRGRSLPSGGGRDLSLTTLSLPTLALEQHHVHRHAHAHGGVRSSSASSMATLRRVLVLYLRQWLAPALIETRRRPSSFINNLWMPLITIGANSLFIEIKCCQVLRIK